MIKKKILILGISGMIGYNFFLFFKNKNNINCYGTLRSYYKKKKFKNIYRKSIFVCKDFNSIVIAINKINPHFILNCVGITKHLDQNINFKEIMKINYHFPLKLSKFCNANKIKFIHLSTDCVFSGSGLKNFYNENSKKTATDNYGISKSKSENLHKNSIIIRTSTVGIEKFSSNGLVNWFLKQKKTCKGYSNAYFTGLPTVVLADMIYKLLKIKPNFSGLINIAGPRISKYHFLKKMNNFRKKRVIITKDNFPVLDRSLNAKKFEKITKIKVQSKFNWHYLIQKMMKFKYD